MPVKVKDFPVKTENVKPVASDFEVRAEEWTYIVKPKR